MLIIGMSGRVKNREFCRDLGIWLGIWYKMGVNVEWDRVYRELVLR